jgi:hypothetical protein
LSRLNLLEKNCLIVFCPYESAKKMKSLRMSGLQKLGVEVYGIQVVSIDAPSLENFCYCPDDSNMEFKALFADNDLCLTHISHTPRSSRYFKFSSPFLLLASRQWLSFCFF